jgi:hypothetical protein
VQLLLLGTLGAAVIAAAPVDLGFDGLQVAEPEEDAEPRAPGPEPDPLDELDTTVEIEDWERLADCESGDWDADGEPQEDSARWDYGLEFDHGDSFQGGLNFHPSTWDSFRDEDMPAHAGRASQVEEIEVAERVLDEQGWDAWPVCSEVVELDE